MNKFFPPSLHMAVTLVWLSIATYMSFLYAPQEETMGEVQRIFYIHASAGETALIAYFLVFFGSIAFLWKRWDAADDFAYGAAEVGFIFCTGVLVTGPLWAKPAWGIWWTWDPRLTLTFLLWLLYIAYLMLRSYVTSPSRAAVLGAVVSILGAVDAPIDYMAIRWWRTQHPQPVIFGGQQSDPRIIITLFVEMGALFCLFTYLLRQYMRVAALRREVDKLHRLRSSMQGA